jgi:hypothetical protein
MCKQIVESGFLLGRFLKGVRINLSSMIWATSPRLRHPQSCGAILLWSIAPYALLFLNAVCYAEDHPKPVFKLIKGQRVEVCEAYLKRLNITEYLDNNPAKGRITEPLLEGFADLKPVPLTADEIQRIYFKTISFARYQNQDLVENVINYHKKTNYKNFQNPVNRAEYIKNPVRNYSISSNTMEVVKKSIEANKKTPFVRYQQPLDLDNDGIADNTVIKNNQGVYIVDASIQRINQKRMNQIFANQEALDWPSMIQFPTLAFPITVFSYKNKFYFDGNFNKLLFRDNYAPNVLSLYLSNPPYLWGVFEHHNLKTQRICEYEWMNDNLSYDNEWIMDFEANYFGGEK